MAFRSVLFVDRDLSVFGGVGRVHLTYARFHDPARVAMSLACMAKPDEHTEAMFSAAGTPLLWIGDGYVQPTVRLRSLVAHTRPSVIVCSSLRSYLLAKAAAVGLGCAIRYWLHSVAQVLEGPVRGPLFRRVSRSDTILCVSDAVRSAHGLATHRRTEVVYNGVEDVPTEVVDPSDRADRRRALGIAADDLVVGFVAAFIGWKDHATLVRAFGAASEKLPQLRLLLVGTGPLMQPTLDLAQQLGCGGRVQMLGARDDVRTLLPLMDLYAHPSRGEGFGLAVVEAMLAGLPVITSDEGAFPEYVLHGTTGLTSPGGDAAALADAIVGLASDPAWRAALGGAGRRSARERFSPTAFAVRFTDLVLADAGESAPRVHATGVDAT